MKTLIVTSLAFALTACAGQATYAPALSPELAVMTPTSTIACRYEKQLGDEPKASSTNWYFWREAQRTETRDDFSHQGEIWEKNNAGQLFYTRLFYDERVALEFVPGDLAATGANSSWKQLSSLLDPAKLGKELALQGREVEGKIAVEHYLGTVNGVTTEVDWLPNLQLPARMVKKTSEGTVTLSLSECTTASKLTEKPISKAEYESFRRLDYTDLGDMEDDPMVQRIEKIMGNHQHGH